MDKESKDAKKITNSQNIIEAHRKAVKLVSVNLRGQQIQIPIFYSMSAAKSYEETLESTNNSRTAFCAMVFTMIENNKSFVDEADIYKNITMEDIMAIGDDDLQKVGRQIIEQSSYLKKHYVSHEGKSFFENFNEAFIKEKKEIGAKIAESLKPVRDSLKNISQLAISPGIKSLLSNIEVMKNLNNAFTTAQTNTPLIDAKYDKELFDFDSFEFENPTFRTNELLQDMAEKLEKLNKIQAEQFENSIKVNEAIANTLLEEQRARVMRDEEERIYRVEQDKQNKRNYRSNIAVLLISTAALLVSVLSFIGYDRVYRWVTTFIVK